MPRPDGPRPGGYIDVDRLQAETTLEQAAAKCGVTLDIKGTGPEVRIDCPFNCHGDHVGRKEVAINIDNPQKIFLCHGYQCHVRGNLLTLMHGFLTGTPPTGGKLKGDEFQRVKRVLAGTGAAHAPTASSPSPSASSSYSSSSPLVSGEEPGARAFRQPPTLHPSSHPRTTTRQQPPPNDQGPMTNASPSLNPKPSTLNLPLIDSPDQHVRELHNIDDKLIRNLAIMNSAAAAYVRRHPCLTPESMTKWRCGYLPNDGGGDKRGWSLRGQIIYPVLSENGKVLAWIGRDPQYEQKERDYQTLSPTERQLKDPPAKHRFPKGFHRSQELYGQHASRLNEPNYRAYIQHHGLTIVEGFNDVINLDTLGIPALAIMSNHMTDAQGEKVLRFAQQLGTNRVNLMLDLDDAGRAGAKEALWFFAEQQVDVRLVWSPDMHDGEFNGKQPESICCEDAANLLGGGPFERVAMHQYAVMAQGLPFLD